MDAASEQPRVLYVDDEGFGRPARRLEEAGFDVVHESDPTAAVALLDTSRVDCVVSGYRLAPMDGVEFLSTVREDHPDLPFVLFTGAGSEAVASEAISAGVTDYVRRGGTDATGEDEAVATLVERVRDAVERSRADRERAAERRRLERAFETVPVGVTMVARDGTIVFANDRAGAVHGVAPDEITARSFDDDAWEIRDLNGNPFPAERLPARQVFETGEPVFDVRHAIEGPDGETRYVSVNAAPYVEDGEVTRVVCAVRDITDRLADDRERERYRTLVETAGDAMYAVDANGRLTMVNTAHVEFSNTTREDLLGSNVAEFMREEDFRRGTEVILDLLRNDDRDRGRFEFRLADGDDERVFEDNVAVLTDDDGGFRGHVGVVRDVTERHRQEERLARQNERLDRFASILGHDLRGPLNVASASIETARETGEAEHFDAAMGAIDRIDRMLEELLALARQGEVVGDADQVDLETAAVEAWQGLDTAGASLSLGDDLPVVSADRTRLLELLENCFRNAVEHGSTNPRSHAPEDAVEHGSTDPRSYTPEDAVEHGTAAANRGRDDAGVTVRVGALAERTAFFVADDGPGIPPEEREQVLERGYTTARDGTGLGLPIVDDVATAHGWSLDIEESEGGGARLVFDLDS